MDDVGARKSWRRVLGAVTLLLGTTMVVLGATAGTAAAAFQGECTPDAIDPDTGTCVIDEPEGNNDETHGVASYEISGTTFTMTMTPTGNASGNEALQVCIVEDTGQDNPYVPTDANDCAGNTPDRRYVGPFISPFVFDLATIDGYEEGDPFFFAFHINQSGMTTYVVGGGDPGTTTTTSTSTTTTSTSTSTTTTSTSTTIPTTTTTEQATTTTLAGNVVVTTTAEVLGVSSTRPGVAGTTLARTGAPDHAREIAWAGILLVIVGALFLRAASLEGAPIDGGPSRSAIKLRRRPPGES